MNIIEKHNNSISETKTTITLILTDTEVELIDSFIKENDLKKGAFTRTAILNEIKRRHPLPETTGEGEQG